MGAWGRVRWCGSTGVLAVGPGPVRFDRRAGCHLGNHAESYSAQRRPSIAQYLSHKLGSLVRCGAIAESDDTDVMRGEQLADCGRCGGALVAWRVRVDDVTGEDGATLAHHRKLAAVPVPWVDTEDAHPAYL